MLYVCINFEPIIITKNTSTLVAPVNDAQLEGLFHKRHIHCNLKYSCKSLWLQYKKIVQFNISSTSSTSSSTITKNSRYNIAHPDSFESLKSYTWLGIQNNGFNHKLKYHDSCLNCKIWLEHENLWAVAIVLHSTQISWAIANSPIINHRRPVRRRDYYCSNGNEISSIKKTFLRSIENSRLLQNSITKIDPTTIIHSIIKN